VILHVPFARAVEDQPVWTTQFDVERWAAEGYHHPLADYRLAEWTEYGTLVPAERKALILTRIATFGEHPHGLGKFTRTMFARDLRRVLEQVGAETTGGVPA
jgi:hypothetical protein